MNGSNGGVVLRWVHLILILLVQVLLIGAVYGSLKFQVEDHSRRLADIERKQDASFIPRPEYDKNREDLLEQLRELRQQVRDIEKKIR